MNIVNIMNFVRRIDEREENSTAQLLDLTAKELELVNSFNVDNTFLLQYDALCDDDFVNLFKLNATDKTELGIWFEIVEPLTTACGMPYRSDMGWKWDWHIIPGFSMAYTNAQKELLIDETMRKFKEVFGYYPKTFASWVLDTYTLNYLNNNYDINAVAICRDQTNTDAYTLKGGYFNQAYFPSVNNIFTPAQSKKTQVNVPVFRLLGPCPIHNYDNHKYSSKQFIEQDKDYACFTLEPCWGMGSHDNSVNWMFKTYFDNENLGFGYAQIGQENSFFPYKENILKGLKYQIEKLLEKGVSFKKMSDTGELFKTRYANGTPATSVVALDNFDTVDVQSVYYNCKNYSANLFRYEDKLFFRSLYLFDDSIKDFYLENICTTFDALFENLPIIDTRECQSKKECGLNINANVSPFTAKKTGDGVLNITFGDNYVAFFEDSIVISASELLLYKNSILKTVSIRDSDVLFKYKNANYALKVNDATIKMDNDYIKITASSKNPITLYPKKI